jgi:cell division protein FtsB
MSPNKLDDERKVKQLLAFYDRKNKQLLHEIAKLKRANQQLQTENAVLRRNVDRLRPQE